MRRQRLVLIRPELRYTRRPDASYNTDLLRAPNQLEYLVGFSFLGRWRVAASDCDIFKRCWRLKLHV